MNTGQKKCLQRRKGFIHAHDGCCQLAFPDAEIIHFKQSSFFFLNSKSHLGHRCPSWGEGKGYIYVLETLLNAIFLGEGVGLNVDALVIFLFVVCNAVL
jgi:hypothetical protein